jgi:eukaryotic-like serine/threonine-protein kinase
MNKVVVVLRNISEEKISRYAIQEELGQGGMAVVYRAYDPLFGREVALKLLKQDRLDDAEIRERFEHETTIIARLEHAAIVPVYDVSRSDQDQLFLVMRYMTGGSLADRIRNGSLSLLDAAGIIQRIGGALDYAHAKDIIHRDLKPGNILFDEYGNAYISDFGIAKLTRSSTTVTGSGIIGTPTHMSPEQARGEAIDGRSDIYSLGVILFEMLTGHTPFEATTPLGMALKHAIEPPPPILDINPSLPASLETVIKKVLEKNPKHRYRSGSEFANAFLGALPQPLNSEPNLVFLPPAPIHSDSAIVESPPASVSPNDQPSPRQGIRVSEFISVCRRWMGNLVKKLTR